MHLKLLVILVGVYTKGSLQSPSLLIVSAPLTLKEYSTPICSVSVMCSDVVVLVKLMLVAVTSTYTVAHHHTATGRPGQVD